MTPFRRWTSLCEEAWCSPDTLKTDEEIAARVKKYSGRLIRAATVHRVREEGWAWVRKQPSIDVGFTIRF